MSDKNASADGCRFNASFSNGESGLTSIVESLYFMAFFFV
jgi:hypothetical protein